MPDLKKMLTLEALSAALPSWLKRSTKPEYNADEIDSTLTTNQFVTASDKATWNAKGTYSKPSGGIPKSDLSSIVQTSLEKADSALQSETDPTVPLWAKQSSKPSYTQDEVSDGTTYKRVTQTEKDTWSGKQNALTTTQMQAVNSGITSEKVTQITTNQTDILYGLETGVKNALVIEDDEATGSGTIKYSVKNGVVTVTGTAGSNTSFYSFNFTGISGRFKLNGCPSGGSDNTYLQRIYTADGSIAMGIDTGSGTAEFTLNPNVTYQWVIRIQANYAIQNSLVFRPMLYQADTDGSTFQTGALPNHDLTRLESEDRAALAEEIDAGAKNKFTPIANTQAGITAVVNSDNSLNITWTAIGSSNAYCRINDNSLKLPVGTYVLSGLKESGTLKYYLHLEDSAGNIIGNLAYNTPNGCLEFTVTDATRYYRVYVGVEANTSAQSTAKKIYPMICTKAAFAVSQKYAPFRLPNNNLGYKTYEINLSAVTINKASSGVYWYKFSVSSDFSKVVSVSLTDGKEIPNKRSFMPYIENGTGDSQAIGFLIADPDAPTTMTFNNGAYMSLTAFGYLK